MPRQLTCRQDQPKRHDTRISAFPHQGAGLKQQFDTSHLGGLAREFAERLQELMECVGGSARSGSHDLASQWSSLLDSGAAMTSLPLRQSQAMLDAIRAQRDQIRALQAQLSLFDEQLTAFDDALRPLLDLGDQFKQAQDKMLGLVRKATGQ